jgi:CRP-like cAMP-binding protein
VRALSSVKIGVVSKEHFHVWHDFRIFLLMKAVPLFRTLPDYEQLEMYSLLEHQDFEDGEYIVTQGDIGDKFYVITDGAVDIVETVLGADNQYHKNILTRLYEGNFFGELALIYDEPRVASVIAVGHTSCLYITKDKFREALSGKQFHDAMEKIAHKRSEMREQRIDISIHGEHNSTQEFFSSSGQPSRKENSKEVSMSLPISRNALFRKSNQSHYINSYEILQEVGRGSYGVVFLARNSVTDEKVVIKSISRSR